MSKTLLLAMLILALAVFVVLTSLRSHAQGAVSAGSTPFIFVKHHNKHRNREYTWTSKHSHPSAKHKKSK
jgi:hypothetical protein